FPPGLGDSYRQAKAFVTAHPPVIEILPKFREEDKAKTLSVNMSLLAYEQLLACQNCCKNNK
ncbi:MAG: hypothetical protein II603_03395, partial [Muribaculaceae bacterium]|nr:hypothetical protein [Muribaculaceae bacterium]